MSAYHRFDSGNVKSAIEKRRIFNDHKQIRRQPITTY